MPTASSIRRLIPNYVSATIALSFGGFLNGYDTGCIGALVHSPQLLVSIGPLSAVMTGVIVSMSMLTAAVPALLSGHLADRHGRLRIIRPGALLFALGAVIQMSATTVPHLLVGRAISGAGQGVILANISVYITEIAPLRRRGRLAAMPQFMATLGISMGYFTCYAATGSDFRPTVSWRLPYVIQVTVALTLAVTCRSLPESPRWLLLQGKADEAARALELLDFDMEEARRDFLSTAQERPSLSNWQTFALLFRPGYRPRTILALFVLSMNQLSGIDAITYYAPALFTQAGVASAGPALVASGIASVIMFVISIPAFILADSWGRRTSAISGGLCLSTIMALIGSLYASNTVDPDHGAARWVVTVALFAFGIVFCATWGIFSKIYASEIQPGNTRAAGNAMGMTFSFFTNWIVSLVTPIMLAASAFGAYFFFAAVAFFTVAILTVHMPETRGRSLESIQSDFQRPALASLPALFRYRARVASSSPNNVDDAIELQPQGHVSEVAAASSVSVDAATRGLRIASASI